jgi:hypothetical protein
MKFDKYEIVKKIELVKSEMREKNLCRRWKRKRFKCEKCSPRQIKICYLKTDEAKAIIEQEKKLEGQQEIKPEQQEKELKEQSGQEQKKEIEMQSKELPKDNPPLQPKTEPEKKPELPPEPKKKTIWIGPVICWTKDE